MLCYELSINGKRVCLVGHEKMEHIQSSVYYSTRMPNPHLSMSAKVQVSDVLAQDARWQSRPLKVGDEVCIRVVEADQPDPPQKLVSFGAKLDPTTGDEELFCSFCGASQQDVELIRGAAGNACHECVKTMNDAFEGKL